MKAHLLTALLVLAGNHLFAQDWITLISGTNKDLNTIDFGSANVGYIGGNDSTLLKSTDGGETWSPLVYSGVGFSSGAANILKIDFVSETVGYMTVGPFGGTYKTTDGGSNWTSLFPGTNFCFNYGLWMNDENNGFVGGSGCFQGALVERQIAGAWSQLDISGGSGSSSDYITDFHFSGQTGLAASNEGHIYSTTDGGSTWTERSTFLGADARIMSVYVVSPTKFYAGYQITGPVTANGLLVSTDGGLNWLDDLNSATFPDPKYYDLFLANSGHFYALGDADGEPSGTLMFTTDYNMWFSTAVGQPLHAMQASTATRLFAVGEKGFIMTNEPFTAGVDETQAADAIRLFPNPAADFIEITGQGKENLRKIELYDAIGSLLGVYSETKINTAHLAPGVYRLSISGEKGSRNYNFIKN